LAECLFSATASGEAFEGGYSNRGEESHDANYGEEFDEGEGRYGTERLLQFLIFDFEFWIGRGDWLTRNFDKNAVHRRGDKRDHDQGIYTYDLLCQHKLTK